MMKYKFQTKTLIVFIVGILLSVSAFSQRRIWTVGTANVLGNKDIRVALFQLSGYGLPYDMEIISQPILLFIAPNLSLKKQWYKDKRLSIATKHGIYFPSSLLKQFAKTEAFSPFPIYSEIPGIVSFRNEVLISYGIGESTCPAFTSTEFNRENTFKGPLTILTFKLGAQNGVSLDESNIDFFIIDSYLFHHTYHYIDKYVFYTGIDIDGYWYKNFDYSVDLDFMFLSNNYWAVEHKAMVKWDSGRKFLNLIFGYQASYGSYPNGDRFFIGPFVDIVWILRHDKLNYGLFGKKLF